jgi:hypothetical protein
VRWHQILAVFAFFTRQIRVEVFRGLDSKMKAHLALFLILSLTWLGCKKEQSTPAPTNAAATSPSSPNPALAPAEYLGALATGKKSATKTIETVSLNRAVQAFSATEGRLPKDLSELSPVYLPKLPDPPYGMKFDYDPASGEVKVVPK